MERSEQLYDMYAGRYSEERVLKTALLMMQAPKGGLGQVAGDHTRYGCTLAAAWACFEQLLGDRPGVKPPPLQRKGRGRGGAH